MYKSTEVKFCWISFDLIEKTGRVCNTKKKVASIRYLLRCMQAGAIKILRKEESNYRNTALLYCSDSANGRFISPLRRVKAPSHLGGLIKFFSVQNMRKTEWGLLRNFCYIILKRTQRISLEVIFIS